MNKLKKTLWTVAMSCMLVASSCVAAFGAEGLRIESSYPKDGQKNTTTENMSVKLTFSQELGSEKYLKQNEKAFSIKGPDGKELPIKVFFNPNNKKEVLVAVDVVEMQQKKDAGKIQDNTKYTLSINKDLTDNNGGKLDKNQTISFVTLNQGWNTKIYMFAMTGIMILTFVLASRQSKKHAREEMELDERDEKFNPYKEAKRTGKPLSQIIADHEKEMAKKNAKRAKLEAKRALEQLEEEEEETLPPGHYKLKKHVPIAERGGKYRTGRKALAEAKRAEEERLAKRRASYGHKKKKKH